MIINRRLLFNSIEETLGNICKQFLGMEENQEEWLEILEQLLDNNIKEPYVKIYFQSLYEDLYGTGTQTDAEKQYSLYVRQVITLILCINKLPKFFLDVKGERAVYGWYNIKEWWIQNTTTILLSDIFPNIDLMNDESQSKYLERIRDWGIICRLFSQLSQVTRFQLISMNLTLPRFQSRQWDEIKKILISLPNLTELEFSGLCLSEIKVEKFSEFLTIFSCAPKLVKLTWKDDLSKLAPDCCQAFGEALAQMKQLSHLILNNNQLYKFDGDQWQRFSDGLEKIETLGSLDLSWNKLGYIPKKTWTKFVDAIVKISQKLTHLYLNDNRLELLSDVQWLKFKEKARDLEKLTHLSLEGNFLGHVETAERWIALGQVLANIPTLNYLHLAYNQLNQLRNKKPLWSAFLSSIAGITSLKQINFTQNSLWSLSPIHWIELGSSITALTHIDFSNNHLGSLNSQAWSGFSTALVNMNQLSSLKLCWNGLGKERRRIVEVEEGEEEEGSEEGEEEVEEGWEEGEEIEEGEEGEHRSKKSWGLLLDILVNLEQLIELDLSGNALESLDKDEWLQFSTAAGQMQNLQHLNVSSIVLRDEFEDDFLSALHNMRQLISLDLSSSSLNECAPAWWDKFGDTLTSMNNLVTLNLSKNDLLTIRDDKWAALLAMLKKSFITCLQFTFDNIPDTSTMDYGGRVNALNAIIEANIKRNNLLLSTSGGLTNLICRHFLIDTSRYDRSQVKVQELIDKIGEQKKFGLQFNKRLFYRIKKQASVDYHYNLPPLF